MRYSPKQVGPMQAAGLAAYVGLFAMLAFRAQQLVHMQGLPVHPILGISLFLLAFVISALICASIMLVYPAMLFFNGERTKAIKVVLWSVLWLAAIFILVALSALVFAIRRFWG